MIFSFCRTSQRQLKTINDACHEKNVFLVLLLSICKADKYTGYVYDMDKNPLAVVSVSTLYEKQITTTNSSGYFELYKQKDISDQLIFKKATFSTDTIASIQIQNGEQQHERLAVHRCQEKLH